MAACLSCSRSSAVCLLHNHHIDHVEDHVEDHDDDDDDYDHHHIDRVEDHEDDGNEDSTRISRVVTLIMIILNHTHDFHHSINRIYYKVLLFSSCQQIS